MRSAIFLTTLLLVINTSAFSQRSMVSGTSYALPSKDFPVSCASQCATLARLWDATPLTGYEFYGCGNWVKKFGYGSDDGTIAGAMRALTKVSGQDAIKSAIKNDDEETALIKSGKRLQGESAATKEYFLKAYEINKCVLSQFTK